MAESFTSVHQLLPSKRYFDLVENNLFFESGDFNNNGIQGEIYTYSLVKNFLDSKHPRFTPGETGRLFHDQQPGQNFDQDNWNNLQNGVEYHHILGEQFALNTVTSMTAKREAVCGLGGAQDARSQYITFKRLDSHENTENRRQIPKAAAARNGESARENNTE